MNAKMPLLFRKTVCEKCRKFYNELYSSFPESYCKSIIAKVSTYNPLYPLISPVSQILAQPAPVISTSTVITIDYLPRCKAKHKCKLTITDREREGLNFISQM